MKQYFFGRRLYRHKYRICTKATLITVKHGTRKTKSRRRLAFPILGRISGTWLNRHRDDEPFLSRLRQAMVIDIIRSLVQIIGLEGLKTVAG
jgi:hypothetical protein